MENSPEEQHVVDILDIQNVTHDVKRFTLSRPEKYFFKPGQATDIVINHPDWLKERRPFTFTGLNDWNELELTIKIYPDHKGVTDHLNQMNVGDELILHDVWGAITYKGEGIFIAGGAGVTPFISIFRQLKEQGELANNQLFFSNKTSADIILKDEFERILGNNFINILSKEKNSKYYNGIMDKDFLKQQVKNVEQFFYICGPDPMIESIALLLSNMGVDDQRIIREEF